ncbi:hypothetical protein E6P09_13425 [Haloferax mediterranei ATCC 33500]|uniref:Uncharacterized protein n=1 Tax=Haloferax mediterranei (strain ATCC 33500 / DSM 1411 / JCM 8866 / NBRC 14739 / NCIMB 2177 / R-4) TaxID=523841 RepID=M0IT34_HALMT|nr:hypothetical protein [Haloferax mediterranei]AHZ23714.1 hypothetical protein BM92_14155 [Haloferax mediterranei ATCC 33500]ELZ99202.1 hypothetical protein C439_15124 [Haloferax mediterranei ATCC 33500]MDX5986898.1 hypothetical protein [Haloferax mediterranei ATCC 33500]QCQ76220.1 hypothetical protein E6P09_13425 [Haloferax mediterranei ATCC 33500]
MQLSEWQWNRIFAFFGGLGILFLYSWAGLYQVVPEWAVDVLMSIPLGLCCYGFTEQPRKVIVLIPVGTALGVGVLILYRASGIHLF